MSTRNSTEQRRLAEHRCQARQTRRTAALERILRRCWQEGSDPLPLIAGRI